MSKYLISTSETYRVDTENEVAAMLDEAKKSSQYDLNKYNCTKKEIKAKGEIVDEYFKVTLVKNFNNEKEPDSNIDITYGTGDF